MTLLSFLSLAISLNNSFASRVDDLQQQINEKNRQMQDIEREIKKYEEALTKNAAETQTLKGQIGRLELERKKLASDITFIQSQINVSSFNIERLKIEIQSKITNIENGRLALIYSLTSMNQNDPNSLVRIAFSGNNLSEFFNIVQGEENFEKSVNDNLNELKDIKIALENAKSDEEKEKNVLQKSQSKLLDKKKLTELNKSQKDNLLKQTKNKDSEYKKILAEKKKLMEAFEAELAELESQLKVAIDPSTLPIGKGILKWPFPNGKMENCKASLDLDNVYCITQYFGKTKFATENPQVYARGTHNGIDMRASEGTEVLASLYGVVRGAGDTDATCKGASYGKWILIEHPNNLSTLYAHLSLIKVKNGDAVESGDLIGYSGNTGYSTGPHLHFTVYATKGVEIKSFPSKACGEKIYTMPIASFNSYLNPLSYL